MRTVLLAIALGTSALAGAAQAQDAAPPMAPARPPMGGGMMRPDANGVITREAAMAQAAARFAQIDTDHDGRISTNEMMAYRQAMRDQMTARGGTPPPPPPPGKGHAPGMGRHAGADRDGVITRDDYIGRAMQRFDRMDTNHDGRIDATERAAMREMARADHRGPRGGGDGSGDGPRGGPMTPPPPGDDMGPPAPAPNAPQR